MPIKEVSQIIEDILKKGGNKVFGERYQLVYDSPVETLEPLYFYVLELMEKQGLKVDKVIDNFSSAPGSSHFGELGQRLTRMQDEAMKILGAVNQVLRSILNITYDLKEMRVRLKTYDDLKSKDRDLAQASRLTLKQIWMDKVDIQKGNSSVKVMALGQAGFQTLLDAFLAADSPSEAEKLDLNDRVKRIVKSRLEEFEAWLGFSGQELTKRYSLEKHYLKSQMTSLRLYSRWVRPYLKVASDLESKEVYGNPDLVKTFNSILLELVLFGKKELDVSSAITSGDLPPEFSKFQNKMKRKYYSIVLIDFYFRGIPQRIGQQGQFAFGGRTTVNFRSYALNEDELEMFKKEMEQSDISAAFSMIDYSDEALKEMENDIKEFLEEEEPKMKEGKKEDANPFLALFGFYNKEKKEEEKEKKEKTLKEMRENWFEKTYLRPVAVDLAAKSAFAVFDVYKKAHAMPSYT
ncbi:MAG: hypothetical protein AABY22_04155 [Nanoarchaeota archaeon]